MFAELCFMFASVSQEFHTCLEHENSFLGAPSFDARSSFEAATEMVLASSSSVRFTVADLEEFGRGTSKAVGTPWKEFRDIEEEGAMGRKPMRC